MKLSLLVVTAGKQEGKVLEIKLPQFLIGRDPQCQLRPASALISKRHCALIQKDGKVYIRDFDSTNGTFVNDEQIKGQRELKHNDQVKVGPIQFVVQLETAPAAVSTKTPAPATKAAPATVVPAVKPDANATPAPAGKAGAPDDDMALEMLMSLDDGSAAGGDPGVVPEGSTVMELKLPPEVLAAAGDSKAGPKQAKPPGSGDTRSAAADILAKMTRRPRT